MNKYLLDAAPTPAVERPGQRLIGGTPTVFTEAPTQTATPSAVEYAGPAEHSGLSFPPGAFVQSIDYAPAEASPGLPVVFMDNPPAACIHGKTSCCADSFVILFMTVEGCHRTRLNSLWLTSCQASIDHSNFYLNN